MKLRLVTVISLAVITTGCATITRGTKDVFVVETTPSGAQVMTTAEKEDGGFYSCEATPCSFKLPRKSEFEVTISKEGYETTKHQITNKISGAGSAGMAGNVLVGGVIGAVVDGTSGAMKDLTPNPLVVTLTPLGESMEMQEEEEVLAGAPDEEMME